MIMVEEMTTYLIEFKNGKRQKVTVPSDWKVTFGPAAVGINKKDGPFQKMPLALRFYENDTKQRAIFTDVVYFRDTSIKIEEEHVDVQQKAGFVECEGKRKQVDFQATTKQWVDPDISRETMPALPSDVSIFDIEAEE
jgi:hypothetical protein